MFKVSRNFLIVVCLAFLSYAPNLFADGCYLCSAGSFDSCRDYCRFSGNDSFDTRKKCESKGCKITGTAACPTASNYKVCSVRNLLPVENLITKR